MHKVLAQLQLGLQKPASNDMMCQRYGIMIIAIRFGIWQGHGKHVHILAWRKVGKQMIGETTENCK